jgi:glucose-1-phosphate adenylyltransferase
MDYRKIIKFHESNSSDLTIAVMQVDINEASRFGIMNTDSDNKITEFEEKPKNPKSTLASMGIYVFSKDLLKTYLKNEELREDTEFDFGGDIIPQIINDGKNVMAYKFDGYWKDVGTISSLWEANMDLLNSDSIIDNSKWPIYSKNEHLNPTYLDNTAVINSASIGENCTISGVIKSSVISNNVVICNNSEVSNSVVHDGCTIGENVVLDYCIVKEGTCIVNDIKVTGTRNNIILVTDEYLKEYNGK